jgi:signal transduction histidine kinase
MTFTTRSKITFISAISNILLLSLTLGLFTLFTRYLLEQKLETDLVLEAEEIITQHLGIDGNRIVYVNSESSHTLEQDLLTDRLSAQIYNKDGAAIGSFGTFTKRNILDSQNLGILQSKALAACTNKTQDINRDFSLANEPHTLLFYPLLRQQQCYGTIVVAADTHLLTELNKLILEISMATLTIALVVNIFMGRITAAVILKPIKELATIMQQLSIERASGAAPLPAMPPHDPIYQLVSTFNSMATQVHEGVQKQKTFIMNASHELKTPLARAASELDIAKLTIASGDVKELQTQIDSAQQELLSVNTIIDVLLQAARLKQVNLERSSISLNKLISKEAKQFSDEMTEKKLSIEIPHTDSIIFMNKPLLTLLIRNCLSNAIRYNAKKGKLAIATTIEGHTLSLHIQNSTEGTDAANLTAETHQKVDSHKLGTIIIANLCELGQCEYTVTSTDQSYQVTISGIPLATTPS